MNDTDVQKLLLERVGLRVGPEVARYVLRRSESIRGEVPVMGSEARTGIAIRRPVALSILTADTTNNVNA